MTSVVIASEAKKSRRRMFQLDRNLHTSHVGTANVSRLDPPQKGLSFGVRLGALIGTIFYWILTERSRVFVPASLVVRDIGRSSRRAKRLWQEFPQFPVRSI